MKLFSSLFCLITAFIALTSSAIAAPEVFTIVSDKGALMKVNLLKQEGDNFHIKRVSDGRKFILSPKMLSPASVKLLIMKSTALQGMYPEIEADVSIRKRRAPKSGISYLKEMEITGKVTLTNKDINKACPNCSVAIIFIGRNQRDENKYKILSNQKFDIVPTPKGALFTATPFDTSYDSDRRGNYNVGGYEYVAYLLVVLDEKQNVILTKTSHARVKKAIEMSANLPTTMMKYPANTILTKMMVKSKAATKTLGH